MSYDYSMLLGKIKERCGSQSNFARAMAISERTVSLKLNGKVDWKGNEIMKAIDILKIPKNEITNYFFKSNVQN